MPKPRHIALALDARDSFSRGVRRGACRFAIPTHRWVTRGVRPDTHGLDLARDWHLDGLIIAIGDSRLLPHIEALRCPVVNLRTHVDTPSLTTVGIDDRAVGELAADHLLSRGLRSIAFLGSRTDEYANRRLTAFSERLAARGIQPTVYRGRTLDPVDDSSLRDWLRSLDRPTGVLAADDRWAVRASELAREAGLSIPFEVALMGVGDDEMCQMTWPPLSSVAIPAERVGFEAARLLQSMLQGEQPTQQLSLIAPTGIQARQSTDLITIEDREVAGAMRYIQDHCHEPIGVQDVVDQTTVNRRWLEIRFRRSLDASILEQIRRARLDRARKLLVDTDHSLDQIARACGLPSGHRLSIVFKQVIGQTPSAYRKQFKLR